MNEKREIGLHVQATQDMNEFDKGDYDTEFNHWTS
jgi:hypothetical protein